MVINDTEFFLIEIPFQGSEEYRQMLEKLERLAIDAFAVGRGADIEELRKGLEARGVPLLERLLLIMGEEKGVEVKHFKTIPNPSVLNYNL